MVETISSRLKWPGLFNLNLNQVRIIFPITAWGRPRLLLLSVAILNIRNLENMGYRLHSRKFWKTLFSPLTRSRAFQSGMVHIKQSVDITWPLSFHCSSPPVTLVSVTKLHMERIAANIRSLVWWLTVLIYPTTQYVSHRPELDRCAKLSVVPNINDIHIEAIGIHDVH